VISNLWWNWNTEPKSTWYCNRRWNRNGDGMLHKERNWMQTINMQPSQHTRHFAFTQSGATSSSWAKHKRTPAYCTVVLYGLLINGVCVHHNTELSYFLCKFRSKRLDMCYRVVNMRRSNWPKACGVQHHMLFRRPLSLVKSLFSHWFRRLISGME
jgi:hypothetical protein